MALAEQPGGAERQQRAHEVERFVARAYAVARRFAGGQDHATRGRCPAGRACGRRDVPADEQGREHWVVGTNLAVARGRGPVTSRRGAGLPTRNVAHRRDQHVGGGVERRGECLDLGDRSGCSATATAASTCSSTPGPASSGTVGARAASPDDPYPGRVLGQAATAKPTAAGWRQPASVEGAARPLPSMRWVLLLADREPQSPAEWERWLTVTRKAVRRQAVTATRGPGTAGRPRRRPSRPRSLPTTATAAATVRPAQPRERLGTCLSRMR